MLKASEMAIGAMSVACVALVSACRDAATAGPARETAAAAPGKSAAADHVDPDKVDVGPYHVVVPRDPLQRLCVEHEIVRTLEDEKNIVVRSGQLYFSKARDKTLLWITVELESVADAPNKTAMLRLRGIAELSSLHRMNEGICARVLPKGFQDVFLSAIVKETKPNGASRYLALGTFGHQQDQPIVSSGIADAAEARRVAVAKMLEPAADMKIEVSMMTDTADAGSWREALDAALNKK